MSGLTENSWILISISVFNLLLYGFLLKVYEEISVTQYVVMKGMNILMAFPIFTDML